MGQAGPLVLGPLQAKACRRGGLSCLGPEAGAPPTTGTGTGTGTETSTLRGGAAGEGPGPRPPRLRPTGRSEAPRQGPRVGGAGRGWARLWGSAVLRRRRGDMHRSGTQGRPGGRGRALTSEGLGPCTCSLVVLLEAHLQANTADTEREGRGAWSGPAAIPHASIAGDTE